jgi:phenylalanyl-tRNA synthetase beta subunit
VQVVCGAPNVAAGMTVAWLPPGSTVPSSIGKDPFVLGARDLRGVVSNGMLASAAELGISDNHDGILEITSKEVGDELCKPGTAFKKLYDLDDIVIDCENKMFTHRPDCFGILGVARELAGITHQKFVSPEWYKNTPVFKEASDLPLSVSVDSKQVPRLMAVAMDNVSVGPSSIHMQAALTRVGIRPINNVVDITNWLMHLTGQPLHAYDYEKVKAHSTDVPTLCARQAKKEEQITLLNGKTLSLDESVIVIATDKTPVGVAGAMGGLDTEVDETTKSIIIEIASFDMYSIRRTSMKYGIFTDAVTRFNKGQSPLQNDRVMFEAIRMMHDLAGATQASKVYDCKDTSVEPMPQVTATVDFINTRLGSAMSVAEATKLLENVECVEGVSIAEETRSYLKGAGDIAEKLERAGIKIVEKTANGDFKLILPEGTEQEYEKLASWHMQPGTWVEYIGAHNVYLFKDLDTKVTRYEVTDDTEHEIVENCRTLANDYFTSIDALLSMNDWYKPLLPLKKNFQSESSDAFAVTVTPPFWRRDLELPEDLVEEIGRLYGFNKLPVELPKRTSAPVKKNDHIALQQTIRSSLVSAGANEVLTYSFVNAKLMQNVGQDSQLAYHIRNAISPDLQYYRMSLVPSLLDKVHMNIKAGYDSFALFEMGRVHNKVDSVAEGAVPEEYNLLSMVVASKNTKANGAAFFQARTYLDYLANDLGLQFEYEPIHAMPDFPTTKPFEPSRSAFVSIKGTKIMLGIVGEFRTAVHEALKLPGYSAGFEIGTLELLEAIKGADSQYASLLRYPKTQQDITLEVSSTLAHAKLSDNLRTSLSEASKQHGYRCELSNGDIFVA